MGERRAAWRAGPRAAAARSAWSRNSVCAPSGIEPMIKTLEEFSRRVDELKARIDEHEAKRGGPRQREPWVVEFRNILRAMPGTPTSLRNRVR